MAQMQVMCATTLALLVYMLSFIMSIGTYGFSIQLTPIDSVLIQTNYTLQQRHHLMAQISKNRVLHLMSRTMNSSEEFMPNTIEAHIGRALSNFYISRMVIGSQLYSPFLAVDTGTDETWVQCDGCHSCFPVKGGNFRYKGSSSYRNMKCNDPLCVPKLCSTDGLCLYKNTFYGGGLSEGWVSTDAFTFKGPNLTTQKRTVAFGCAYNNQDIRFGQNYGPNNVIAGIFGLGSGPRSLLKQLDSETKGRFSYCLPAWTAPKGTSAFLTFGNEAVIKGKSQTTPLVPVPNIPAYNVKLLEISIGTKRLSIDPALFKLRSVPSGGFFTDSGSPYTVFIKSAYRILRQEMVQYVMQHYRRSPIEEREGPLDLCYKASEGGHSTLPTMTYHLDRANLMLDSKAVFEPINTSLCMAILPTRDQGVNVLGAFQQANNLMHQQCHLDQRFAFRICKSIM